MSTAPKSPFAKDSWQTPRNARTLRAYMALHNQEIADRLKELRASKGNPPQRRVADAIAVDPRTLQMWEAGDAKPSFRNLEPLARYYGVSESYILTGEENSVQESPVVVTRELDEVREEFHGRVDHVEEMLERNYAALEQIFETLLVMAQAAGQEVPTPPDALEALLGEPSPRRLGRSRRGTGSPRRARQQAS